MAKQEFQRLGFISQEHYEATLKTLQSNFTGEYAPGGMTGCMMPRSAVEKVHRYFEAYQQNVEKWNEETPDGKYPPRVDLTAGLPPVFNQHPRGTCVAQAVTGLANYYFGKTPVLSTEYTYGVIKKYECAEFGKAYQAFIADPMKYLQGTENISGECGTAAWYLKHCFPDAIKKGIEKKRENEAARKSIIPQPLMITEQDYAAWLYHENPANEDGSFLTVAHRVFQQEGFCTSQVLPYKPRCIAGNTGHLPMPVEAVQDAAARRITDELHLFRDPGDIDEFKKFLSGNNGQWNPMPVAISVFCFASWNNSPFTKRTGWFSMPIPEEETVEFLNEQTSVYIQQNPNATKEQIVQFILEWKEKLDDIPRNKILNFLRTGGHAMLAVGYVDEPIVAGGGYLLVRNSWAETWAWEGEHPGCAKIPYAYIENFCSEALSIIKPRSPKKAKTSETPLISVNQDAVTKKQSTDIPAPEVALLQLTGDSETLQEALHLTHRLAKDGYRVRFDIERLPSGELKERWSTCPATIRDVILLAGEGDKISGKDLTEKLSRLSGSGKNIISVQLGKTNSGLQNSLPESCRDLISYNRIKIQEHSFNDDFAELEMRLKSRPLQNSLEISAFYKSFRDMFKASIRKIVQSEHDPDVDLYQLLKRNMSFQLLEALILYLCRKGFHILDSGGSQISHEQLSERLSAGKCNAVTLESKAIRDRFYIKFDHKRNSGVIMKSSGKEETNRKSVIGSFYQNLKSLFTPMTFDPMPERQNVPDAAPKHLEYTEKIAAMQQAVSLRSEDTERTAAQNPKNAEVAEALRRKNEFSCMIDRNIRWRDMDYCFPDLDLEWKYKLLPWKLQVKEVHKRDCRIEDLIARLEAEGLMSPEDRELVKKTSTLSLYELKNGGVSVMIAAVYLTLWKNGKKIPLNDACMDLLQEFKDCLKRSMLDLYCPRLSGTGLLLGTSNAVLAPEHAKAYRKNAVSFCGGIGEFAIYCDYNTALEKWSFVFPESWNGYYWWHFVEHLLPIDPALCLKELIEKGNNGCTVTKLRLEKNLGLPHAIFTSAFARLKPILVKKGMVKTEDGKEIVEYELDRGKSHEMSCSISGHRRISYGVWNYIHCVIYSAAFAFGAYIAYTVFKTPLYIGIFIVGAASLIAKCIVEWNDRRIQM